MTEKAKEQKKNDWALKLLAVVFAVMLWFYADAEQNPMTTKVFDVPVQYVNQGEGYLAADGVTTVRVTARGKAEDLGSLRGDDFTATVDLSGAVVGSAEYAIVVSAPNVMERFSYQPTRTMLNIDQVQTKEVSVRVRTTGTLPAGYTLAGTEVVPETVTISGLSRDVAAVSNLETTVIDISGMTAETTQEVALQLPEGITVAGEQRVAVHFTVQEQQAHYNYEAKVELINIPENMEVTLERETVTLLLGGSSAALGSQRELDGIQVYVNCAGLTAGEHRLPIQVNYSGSLQVSQITPDSVTVLAEPVEDAVIPVPENRPTDETGEQTTNEGELN